MFKKQKISKEGENPALEKIKQLLLQEKKRLENDLSQIAQKDQNVKGNYNARYLDLGDKEDENAQEVTLYENRLSLEKNLEDALEKTSKALEKIEKGTYGICDECGEEIPKDRLNAFPSATLCLKCKSKK